jgi:hypothetical protein
VAQSVNEELIKGSKVTIFWVEFNSLKELDSIQNRLHNLKNAFNYWVVKGIYSNRKQYTRRASRKVLKSFCIICQKFYSIHAFFPLIFGFSTTKNDGITLIMAFYTSLFSFLLLIFLLLFLTNKVLSLFQESSILSFSTGLLILWIRLDGLLFLSGTIAFTMKHD